MSPMDLGNRNVLSLQHTGRPLCVECLSCHHRALLSSKQLQPAPYDHEMNSLVSLTKRMRCSECKSGSVKAFIPESDLEAEAFNLGFPIAR